MADIPEDLVDKFNSVETGYPVFADDLKKIMEEMEWVIIQETTIVTGVGLQLFFVLF